MKFSDFLSTLAMLIHQLPRIMRFGVGTAASMNIITIF